MPLSSLNTDESTTFDMKQTYTLLAGLLFGLSIGIAFAWALQISEDREQAELAADLNAYRVMAEWDRFEEGRP